MSESECYERSNSFVTLTPSGHLFSTDSVHVVIRWPFYWSHLPGSLDRMSQMQLQKSIINADNILAPFGHKWTIATLKE